MQPARQQVRFVLAAISEQMTFLCDYLGRERKEEEIPKMKGERERDVSWRFKNQTWSKKAYVCVLLVCSPIAGLESPQRRHSRKKTELHWGKYGSTFFGYLNFFQETRFFSVVTISPESRARDVNFGLRCSNPFFPFPWAFISASIFQRWLPFSPNTALPNDCQKNCAALCSSNDLELSKLSCECGRPARD